MNIVLADDESLARINLRSVLESFGDDWTIAGEAKNGDQLLVLLKQILPDLVFVDIRMPKLDGLGAIRRGKEISPHTQWVVISGFSEFQYAQEALELGVSHYLLKPVSPSDLKKTVDDIQQRSDRQLAALNHEFENTTVALLHHCSRVEDIPPDSILRQCRMAGYLLYVDGVSPQEPGFPVRGQFAAEVRKTAAEHLLSRDSRFAVTTTPQGQIAVIAASTLRASPLNVQWVQRFEQNLMSLIQRFGMASRLSVSAMRTPICNGMETLLGEWPQLQHAGPLRTLLPYGRCLNADDLLIGSENPEELLQLGRRLERIAERYRSGDFLPYAKEVSLLAKNIKSLPMTDRNKLRLIPDFLKRSIGFDGDMADIGHWTSALEQHGERNLLHSADPTHESKDLVQAVIDYVDDHYMHDIGIGQIAKELGITYNYLSTLFHKKNGITFIHYLTKTRMLKAKQLLLSHPKMKIVEVASQVGYYSTRHFTKAFTKHYHCYPSEIREQHRTFTENEGQFV